jgi:DNA-binding HxlR family transcriptional regulator
MPASDSFANGLAKKFGNLAATRDLLKTLHRNGALQILILLREVKEIRSTDIESLIVSTGAAESSSIWDRLRDLKAHGVIEEVPHQAGAKLSTVKNRLTPPGNRLMDTLYELNKELSELPKPSGDIEGFRVDP